MKTGYVHMSFLLDASSSMHGIKKSIIDGFNEYIDEQRKNPGEATVTLAQFAGSGSFKYIYNMADIKSIESLNQQSYTPSGMTALNDALGKLINETGQTLSAMKEEDRPEGVMFIIMTDGAENDSRIFTQTQTRAMVAHQEQKYSWKFIYIGANQDSHTVGGTYAATASMNFSAEPESVKRMFSKVSRSNTMYRSNVSSDAFMSQLVDDEPQKQTPQPLGSAIITNMGAVPNDLDGLLEKYRALKGTDINNQQVQDLFSGGGKIRTVIKDPDTNETIGSQG